MTSAHYAYAPKAGTAVKGGLLAICLIVLTALLQIGLGSRGFF